MAVQSTSPGRRERVAGEHDHPPLPPGLGLPDSSAALDCFRELSKYDVCERWPEHLCLLNMTTGELIRGRCRATNLCRYCQRLYVAETVEMLLLDAAEYAPTLWAVLTAREHLTRSECRQHLESVRRRLRPRWPGIEWFVQVEFQRRGALHLNLLIKGVATSDEDALRRALHAAWCRRVDALPVGQWLGVIDQADRVTRYIAKTLAHGLKAEQSPPIGWRGHRTSQTRGYLVRPASVMRLEARRSRRLRALMFKGLSALDAEAEVSRSDSWRIMDDPALSARGPMLAPCPVPSL